MHILISGAGIAGLASALELATRGHDITIVEFARHLRLEGTPVDVRGDAIATVAGMGLIEKVREQRLQMSESSHFVDSDGESVGRVPLAEMSDADDIEILREDLMRILVDALPDAVTIRFDDSIQLLNDDGGEVRVRFGSGRTGQYDLVLGADGQHSAVRRLVFGPDEGFLRHLGVYFALAEYPSEAQSDCANAIYNVPGRMAGIFRYAGKTVAVLQFHSEPVDHDHRDRDAQKKILTDAFAGYRSWRIPELLDAARADPRLYFTSASQIDLSSWHRGRVVLVGDAGYCPSFLSGRGTSLALTGAQFLAEEIGWCGNRPTAEHTSAFERYEARLRPHVSVAHKSVHRGRDHLVPATWAAIAARNERVQGTEHARAELPLQQRDS